MRIGNSDAVLDAAMNLILELRADARTKKDFTASDKIRDQLSAAKIIVKDHREKASEWGISS
jgi:cysteinyl-tRNA synthetase